MARQRVLMFIGLVILGSMATRTTAADEAVDFALQGEYVGAVESEEGPAKLGVQVVALGSGRFRAAAYIGGLPGAGWNGEPKEEAEASLVDGRLTFQGQYGDGTVQDQVMKVVAKDGQHLVDLKRVVRESPTLGEKPAPGAIVLFDGSSPDNFVATSGTGPARMTDDGLLMQGANSKRRFGSHKLHIEFRTPFQPEARGQGRGNSGCYLQSRYEVQVLDSFGLVGENNECGGIYEIKATDVNMCFPPRSWQTYDIDFTAAEYDDDGKKRANARITVRHNGVLIHDNVEIPRTTRAAPLKEGPELGPLHLQDHGNPIRYRNIWAVEKK